MLEDNDTDFFVPLWKFLKQIKQIYKNMNLKFDMRPKLLDTLRGYTKEKFAADLMAGLIVGIVALPLAIAFGIASGVSPEEGLITAVIGGFLVSAFGGCTVQIGGPTGAFIVIVYGIIEQFGIEGLLIATVLAGILLLLMGVLKLGAVIRFIPYPIIVGFTSGIALTIFSTQIADLFGLTTEALPGDFVGKWGVYFQSFDTTTPLALIFGILTIAIIVLTPKISKRIPGSLVAIVLMTVAAYVMKHYFAIDALETIGDRFTIKASLPQPRGISFDFETVQQLLPSALTIALLGAIESLLSATVADGVTGTRTDSNMELVAQGAANVIVPFFGGIPVTGAIARTMTNINNGGKTPVSGLVHAVVLLLILLFLGPLTAHIPMACLAGVLVVVSYNMSEWRTFKRLCKGAKGDVAVLVTTFLLTVFFDLTIAIVLGLLIAMLTFMRRMSEVTQVSVAKGQLDLSNDTEHAYSEDVLDIPAGVEVYHIDGPFFFGVASKFDSVMQRVGEKSKVRIIRMRRVPFMDSTGVHNLQSLITSSQDSGIKVILSGVKPSVRAMLHDADFEKLLGQDAICDNIEIALETAKKYVK